MLILGSTSDLVRVVTSAAADIEAHASWVDNASGTITPGRTNTASITTATTTTVVGSPGSSTQRNVKHLNLRNNDGATSCDVTVEHTDGTNAETLMKVTLLAGEVLAFDQVGGWTHYDANGGIYGGLPVATQTEQEGGTSNKSFVTPGNQHQHPSAAKCWGKANGAGTSLLVSYNVTGISDTGTGRLGVTVATDFSSANYSLVASIERGVTTLAVADVEMCGIRNASPAAGSFEIESIDHTATTMVADDPTSYFWACFGDQ